ncbi:hypothetical protein Bca4012_098609 [Brassica carinata]
MRLKHSFSVGFCCTQLVGSMSMAARDVAINKFTEDPNCRIFLMSLKAGGVALKLTVLSMFCGLIVKRLFPT